MNKLVRVYLVEKNGRQDILTPKQESNGHIPRTVDKVCITWEDGKKGKSSKVNANTFKKDYKHIEGCYWQKAN